MKATSKSRTRPRVTVGCVADRYSRSDERIIEFIDPETRQGGLIALYRRPDGTLVVDVYRTSEKVVVVWGEDKGSLRA